MKTVRSLDVLKLSVKKNYLELVLGARSFLWQMCRRITTHLIEVGYRITTLEKTALLLEGDNSTRFWIRCPSPALPENLFLHEIVYDNVSFELIPDYLAKLEKAVIITQQKLKKKLEHGLLLEKIIKSRKLNTGLTDQ